MCVVVATPNLDTVSQRNCRQEPDTRMTVMCRRFSCSSSNIDVERAGPIQGNRCRILMEPEGRDSIDLQGVECDRTKHAVELGGKQGIEDLPEPVIMERSSREAGLEQGDHATILQAGPQLTESMMDIENRAKHG